MKQHPRKVAALAFVVALCSASIARADAPTAEALDAEATALMEQRRYAEACPKLEESDRLKPGTGVILRLALCYERQGKTASAWSTFRIAATRAELAGDVTLRELATKRAEGIEPRLPTIHVRLPADVDVDAIEVQCDGVPIDRATLRADRPIHLDPGPHTLQATSTGRRTFRTAFVGVEGAAPRTIAIELPQTQANAIAAEPGAERTGDSQRTLAAIAGGVGIAGIAIGSIFGLTSVTKWHRARSECASAPTGCSAEALDLEQTVRTDALVSTIAFGVGAAGVVGGAILWWTAPRAAIRTGATVTPIVASDRVGVAFGGRF